MELFKAIGARYQKVHPKTSKGRIERKNLPSFFLVDTFLWILFNLKAIAAIKTARDTKGNHLSFLYALNLVFKAFLRAAKLV